MPELDFQPLVESEFTQLDDEISDPDELDFKPLSQFGEEAEEERPEKNKKKEGSKLLDVAGQLSMRGLESIISLPRGAGELLESVVPEKLIKKGLGKVGLGEGAEYLLETTKKYAPYKLFPTEEQARKFTKTIFGDLYEPENELEEKLGVGFGEFVSLIFPFLGPVKPKKAFLLAAGANAAKETGEWLGLSDKQSNLMKFGTYVLGAFLHPKWAQNFYNKTFKAAENILPQNAKVSTTSLLSTLDELEIGFRKAGVSSADTPALKQLENLKGEMQGALIPVDSLVVFKKKFNNAMGDIYKQLEGNKSGIKTAKRNMEMVGKAADDAIGLYAKQNPTWGKFHRESNNAFAAVKNSERASKFLKSKWPKIAITHAGLSALLGHFAGLQAGGVALAAGAAAYPAYKGVQTLNRIMRSPSLRKEYFNILQESARGNLSAVEKSVRALDKGLQGSEEENQ